MIVQRVSVKAKPGHRDELVELLKAERARDDPGHMRILTAGIGAAYKTVVYELTSKDIAENQEKWEEWQSKPSTREFMEKWFQLADDWSDEIWEIVE